MDVVSSIEESRPSCAPCSKTFSAARAYQRHLSSLEHQATVGADVKREFICEHCGLGFTREYDRKRHIHKGACRPDRLDDTPKSCIPAKRRLVDEDGDNTDIVSRRSEPVLDGVFVDPTVGHDDRHYMHLPAAVEEVRGIVLPSIQTVLNGTPAALMPPPARLRLGHDSDHLYHWRLSYRLCKCRHGHRFL